MQINNQLDGGQGFANGAAAAAVAGLASQLYISTHFTSNRLNAHIERLMVSVSSDGVSWRNVGGLLYGSTIVRDPSSWFDGSKWWVCYTDASVSSVNSSFSICSSIDLLNWELEKQVVISRANTQNVWAPEWFVDSDGPHIIFTIRTHSQEYDLFEMHPVADVGGAWSDPVRLTFTSETHKTNDNTIIKAGSLYVLFYQETDTAAIQRATSSSLLGPWTIDKTGDWAGWGVGYEGPSVIATGTKYRIYLSKSSPEAPVSYYYSESSDLLTWSAVQPLDQQVNMQHGTFRSVTDCREVSRIAAIVAANDPMTNVRNRIAPVELQVYSYPDVDGKTILSVVRDLQGGIIQGCTRTGAFVGPYTGAATLDIRVGNGLGVVVASFNSSGEIVMLSPDGTQYKLRPPNGGGAATWVAV